MYIQTVVVVADLHIMELTIVLDGGLSARFFFFFYVCLSSCWTSVLQMSLVRYCAFYFRHLVKLPRLLESEDVNMRIAAGETIALLFELARDVDAVSFDFITLKRQHAV